jgi:hypothetical protein
VHGLEGRQQSLYGKMSALSSAVQETFCGIHAPTVSISDLDIVKLFENIFYAGLM